MILSTLNVKRQNDKNRKTVKRVNDFQIKIMRLAMKNFLVGVMAVSSLALLIFSGTTGNTLCAQDSSNKLNMLEIVISNLIARVEALEKRVSALEKNTSAGASKAQKKEASIKEPPKSALTNVLFTGEIANRSEKNYRFAKFNLEIYDDRDLLVKKEEFTVPDLPKDSVRPFEHMLVGVEAGLINRYMIKAVE